jgi:hypothetical protein
VIRPDGVIVRTPATCYVVSRIPSDRGETPITTLEAIRADDELIGIACSVMVEARSAQFRAAATRPIVSAPARAGSTPMISTDLAAKAKQRILTFIEKTGTPYDTAGCEAESHREAEALAKRTAAPAD